MISVYCEGHQGHALISTNDITAMQRLAGGLKVAFVCTCGHAGAWLIARESDALTEAEPDPAPKRVLDNPAPLPASRHAGVAPAWLGLIRR
jgi:hypothetical protein